MGFSRNMQFVYNQNKELLSDRKTYAGGRQSFPKERKKLKFKETDEKSLQDLRTRVKKEKLIDNFKIILVFLIILTITLLILIFVC